MQVQIYYHLSISSCVLWICGLLVFGFVDLFFISLSQSHASSDLLSYLYFWVVYFGFVCFVCSFRFVKFVLCLVFDFYLLVEVESDRHALEPDSTRLVIFHGWLRVRHLATRPQVGLGLSTNPNRINPWTPLIK